MRAKEIKILIKVGLDNSALYKRSVWTASEKVMEFLSDNTDGEIVRNKGVEKYISSVEVTDEKMSLWALSYLRHIGAPLYAEDVVPELYVIARELGIRVTNPRVLNEYFRRYPDKNFN